MAGLGNFCVSGGSFCIWCVCVCVCGHILLDFLCGGYLLAVD